MFLFQFSTFWTRRLSAKFNQSCLKRSRVVLKIFSKKVIRPNNANPKWIRERERKREREREREREEQEQDEEQEKQEEQEQEKEQKNNEDKNNNNNNKSKEACWSVLLQEFFFNDVFAQWGTKTAQSRQAKKKLWNSPNLAPCKVLNQTSPVLAKTCIKKNIYMLTLQSCKFSKCLFLILWVKQVSQSDNIYCLPKVFPF